MNKTEARFSTSNIGQVAFFLWKEVLPDRLEIKKQYPLFLYYNDHDYLSLARHYWEGDYIPACEMGECISIVLNIIEEGEIKQGLILNKLEEINEYREWYNSNPCDNTIGGCSGEYFDIIDKLISEE